MTGPLPIPPSDLLDEGSKERGAMPAAQARAGALRAEPRSASQAEPLIPIASDVRAADLALWHDAFVALGADYITVDGWVGRPARERVWRAEGEGWLVYDPKTSAANSEEQYTAHCYRPTQLLRDLLAKAGQP